MAFHWQAGHRGGGGGEVLRISSDGDNRRIFFWGGVEIFHSGMFLGSRDFLGIQNHLKNCGSGCVSWLRSSANIK